MPTDTANATTIAMPQLGESVTEGTIGTWLKSIGDRVDKFDPLVEVVTDKVNAEIPAPVAGTLVAILVDPDTTVPVGTGLCLIDESSTAPSVQTAAADVDDVRTELALPVSAAAGSLSATSSASMGLPTLRRNGNVPDDATLLRVRSSPAVRRIAGEHGLSLVDVPGTGIHGRVTKQDILAHLATLPEGVRSPQDEPTPVSAPTIDGRAVTSTSPPLAAASPAPSTQHPLATISLAPGDQAIPLTPMRRAVAEHMVRSERAAPHVTVVMEVDMTRVVALRAAQKDGFKRREGIDLTYLPFAIKAATVALRDHPRLNSTWDEAGDRIVHRAAINVGVAVGLEDGLVVPVIKHADRLSLAGLAHAVSDLAARARANTLTPDDVAGGTFTMNNPGTFGSIVSTPILVQPQAAILSTEAIVKRPIVIDDLIGIRSMMNLSLSIDHRVLDGLAAARFLGQVKSWLESVDDALSLY